MVLLKNTMTFINLEKTKLKLDFKINFDNLPINQYLNHLVI